MRIERARTWGLVAVGVTAVVCAPAISQPSGASKGANTPLSLEQIMSDPDWIGRSPERPVWSDDAKWVYYSRKREGSELRDLWRVRVSLEGTGAAIRATTTDPELVPDVEKCWAPVRSGDWSDDFSLKVYSRDGDLFLRNVVTGDIKQITRTRDFESFPRFFGGSTSIMFDRSGQTVIRELATGFEYQLADVRFDKDPDAKDKADKSKKDKGEFLKDQQERLFDHIQVNKKRREEAKQRAKEEAKADSTKPVPTIYLGDELEMRGMSISPTGEWAIVRGGKKGRDTKRESMPEFVTEDGYVKNTPVRGKVGTSERSGEELFLVDLRPASATADERWWKLDLSVLPGIKEDPLAALKARPEPKDPSAAKPPTDAPETKPEQARKSPAQASVRAVIAWDIEWSDKGSRVVFQAFTTDNKDRWIASVDLGQHNISPIEHLHDDAWINGRFAQLGWLKDEKTIWFLSEESGYSQLHLEDLSQATEAGSSKRRITGAGASGRYEVSGVERSRDGAWLYFKANMERPTVYEWYAVSVQGDVGRIVQLTALGGNNDFTLSPDESAVVALHSTTTAPPEIYIQPIKPGIIASATRATKTVGPDYEARTWITPDVLPISGRDGRTIWSRVYDSKTGSRKRPAVVFVHGAGYLQDAHEGWSYYFHEHLFHNLLCQRGYVVLDMDYRASEGYGRDWRTAIYQRMGTPELEDLEDGVQWLVKERGVDAARIGVYGGSYGGFLTLMGLFTKPDLFACGAALRPVTDWAYYSDGYTANILNTPTIDPDAYKRSSPIELASGLTKPLLICHGMVDDNVFFQDTVRLVQRLIELKKEGWEVAMYPIEAHGFREPTSWLDEYRRILRLFETNLRK